MNKTVIGITLTVLIVLTLFSVVLGGNFSGKVMEFSGIDGESITNSTSTSFTIESQSFMFNIDPLIGTIAIIILIATVGAIVGIQVLASGLSPESVKILIIAVAYTGIWFMLSALASPLIFSIEIFGQLIYITLTLGYTIGVVQKFTGAG